MANPQIIGEGTYGCVAKPSLTCNQKKPINYQNKVSKIMVKKYAESEYEEMRDISSIPGIGKYIVPMPELCRPNDDSHFKEAMKSCENKKFKSTSRNNFRLLIFEDGGLNLKQFTTDILPTLSTQDLCIFLTKVTDLIEGLGFFNKNNIIHHDIKTRNIVYNIETAVIKYIDFGLVYKKSDFIRDSTNSTNTMAQSWDNFPPEYKYANQDAFALNKSAFTLSYIPFIEKVAYTFDSYSLGIAMVTVMNEINKYKWDVDLAQIQSFFEIMGNKNISSRDYDVFKLPVMYKQILTSAGIWTTLSPKPQKNSILLQNKLIMKNKYLFSNEPPTALKACDASKERNPITQRCVKKCLNHQRRTKHFKCRRKRKSVKKKNNTASSSRTKN